MGVCPVKAREDRHIMGLDRNNMFANDPMAISLRGMNLQIKFVQCATENLANTDIPGYQRKIPVVTTFANQLGYKGVDTQIDTTVGRLHDTRRPLDTAINGEGYYQKLSPTGSVELTRDGRFRLDKDGYLLSTDQKPILSRQGSKIKFPFIPARLENIKIKPDGWIEAIDPSTQVATKVAQLGVASQQGKIVENTDIRQGFVEESNVLIYEEYANLVGQGIQANRQMFLTHSQNLSRLIQELGRTQ